MESWVIAVIAVGAFVIGAGLVFLVFKLVPSLKKKDAERQGKQIIRDAEIKAERSPRMPNSTRNKRLSKPSRTRRTKSVR
jgi:heme/copper-type cytochrome/quinol oxidase subunit 1